MNQADYDQFVEQMLEWSQQSENVVNNYYSAVHSSLEKERISAWLRDLYDFRKELGGRDERNDSGDTMQSEERADDCQQLALQAKALCQRWNHEQVANMARSAETGIQYSGFESNDDRAEPDVPQPAALNRVPIGGHELPPLPYDYDALEPYISEQIMRLHHTEHHQSYVDGLNEAERQMAQARQSGNFDLLRHWEREAAFHGSGHYLHTVFWNNMRPDGGGRPTGALARQIEQDFGSIDAFKAHFTQAAEQVEGVGWAILVWAPRAHRLEILQTEKHQLFTQWDTIPLLVLDVWEHAYYLQYPNERKTYIDNWWNVVNWENVAERYAQARQLRWQPF